MKEKPTSGGLATTRKKYTPAFKASVSGKRTSLVPKAFRQRY
ncbi:hypothetical protein [Hymenobacter negativus]|nr:MULTISPECIES: hypothetical protein [Bacteria]